VPVEVAHVREADQPQREPGHAGPRTVLAVHHHRPLARAGDVVLPDEQRVEGNVEGAGHVAGLVLAARPDVDDDRRDAAIDRGEQRRRRHPVRHGPARAAARTERQ